MNVGIKELIAETEEEYEALLSDVPTSLLYHSLQFRNFLRTLLTGAKDRYLLAYMDDQLVAALPSFVKPGPFGTVVNSLPFYGSNGSVVAREGCSAEVSGALLEAFDRLCLEENAITSTVVDNPLDPNDGLFNYKADLFDERIGQLTRLPHDARPNEVEDRLMSSFHVKTRNLVRKGTKSHFEVGHDNSKNTMRQLHELHESNMQAIGVSAKSWKVFQSVRQSFEYDKQYRVYTASKNGITAASLLVFFCNKTAEYFTPVIHPAYRSEQPLSCLIFLAMQDAVAKGCRWWNWGGTWLSQDGVYHFKSRWGTQDFRYRYFVRTHTDTGELFKRSKSELLEAYPYFYVTPFNSLEAA